MILKSYVSKRFKAESKALIRQANALIIESLNYGIDLTLRQLYYRLVAQDVIPNNLRSYKNLGNLISDARRAGLIDWEAIVDRARNLMHFPRWDSPLEALRHRAQQYDIDWWAKQDVRVEVWVEKEALIGVVAKGCEPYRVDHFACKGYVSDSEIWRAAQRVIERARDYGQGTVIIHLGDHDPSGIDMTRDIEDRFKMFSEHYAGAVVIKRIALTMDQIEEEQPPPNPAKESDSRFQSYLETYGDESWELDSLPPPYIVGLISEHIEPLINQKEWAKSKKLRDQGEKKLNEIADKLERGEL